MDIDFSQVVSIKDEQKKESHFILISVLLVFCLFFGVLIFIVLSKSNKTYFISPIREKTAAVDFLPVAATQSSMLKKEIIGFLPSWEVAKKSKINPSRLTQLIYFGLGVTEKGELVKFNEEGKEVLEWTYFNSEYFSDLRKEASASGTKVLLALKNFDNENIDNLISNEKATQNLVKQVAVLIRQYQLDGVNVDFEYFSDTDFPTMKYLNNFLTTLSKELKKVKPDLIVSFDVNAVAVIVDRAYDMVKIGEAVDQIILMAYDYHRVDSKIAGPVAPLDGSENEHSITQSLQSLVGRVPAEKIILGLPFYGYEWQTVTNKYKSPTILSTGALATYKRVRELLEARPQIKVFWEEKAASPWFFYEQSGGIKQVYFENEFSIAKKLELVEARKLGGIGIWALGYEGEYQDLWQVIQKNK